MWKSNSDNFIIRLQKGKEDALEWIYDNYIGFVKSIVCKVRIKFNDDGIIEECINDVFVSVWNNSSKFKGNKDNFRNWIGAIARFKAIDYYRNISKKCDEQLDEIYEADSKLLEDEIIDIENRKEVMNLLDQLNEVDKKIFVMKYFLEMTSEEIAKKVGVTKMAVDGRIYRNKKKLKKMVSELNMEVI